MTIDHKLLHIYLSIVVADTDDIRAGRRDFHASICTAQFSSEKHLPFHVHDGILLGEARRVIVKDDIEFERSNHFDVERRLCVILSRARRLGLCIFIAGTRFRIFASTRFGILASA